MNDGLAPPPGIALDAPPTPAAPAPAAPVSREDAFRAGQPIAPGRHDVVLGGKMYSVPAEKVGVVLDAGGRFATPDESHAATAEEDYANHPAEAALYGGARGLTLGLSDKAAAAVGSEVGAAERLAGIKEHNAGVSTATELGGMALPALIPGLGGATIAGRVAEAGMAADAAVAAKLGGGVLAKAAGRVVGGAIEGGAFGGGMALSEAALENQDLSAEALLSSVGQGAVFGAAGSLAAGSALDAGAWALKGAYGSGKSTLGKMFARNAEAETGAAISEGVGDVIADAYAKTAEVTTGAAKDTVRKFTNMGPEGKAARDLLENASEVRQQAIREGVDVLDSAKDFADDVAEGTFGNVRADHLRQMAKDYDAVAAHTAATEDIRFIQSQAEEMAAAKEVWGMKAAVNDTLADAAAVRSRIDAIVRKGGPDATGDIANEMNWFKQRVGRRVIKGPNINHLGSTDSSANARFAQWYDGGTEFGGLKNHLEREDLYGPAAAMMKEVNAKASAYIQASGLYKNLLLTEVGKEGFVTKFAHDSKKLASFLDGLGSAESSTAEKLIVDKLQAEKEFVEVARKYMDPGSAGLKAAEGYETKAAQLENWLAKARDDLGTINQGKALRAAQSSGILGAAISPMRVVGALSLLDRAGAAMARKTDGAIGGVVARAMGVTKRATAAAVEGVRGLRGPALASAYRASAEQARAVAANGDGQSDRRVAAVAAHAPAVAAKYAEARGRANDFLTSKLPPQPEPTAFAHLEEPRVPESQMRSFMEYKFALDHPDRVLEEIKAGDYVPEHIETLKAIYPATYARVVQGVTEKLTKAKKKPSWQSCQELHRAFGIQCDPSQNPRFIATMQTIEGGDPSAQGQPPRPAGPATKAPNVSADVMSESTRIASR